MFRREGEWRTSGLDKSDPKEMKPQRTIATPSQIAPVGSTHSSRKMSSHISAIEDPEIHGNSSEVSH